MTADELLTKKDLEDFKRELFELLDPVRKGQAISQQKWLKSMDVRKILGALAETMCEIALSSNSLLKSAKCIIVSSSFTPLAE